MKFVSIKFNSHEVRVEFNAFLDVVKTAALTENDGQLVAAELFNAVGYPDRPSCFDTNGLVVRVN